MSDDFWDEWRGSLEGEKVMLIKNLLSWRGYKLDLHKFVGTDAIDCFHTHPAKAIRFVIWGGYVEEMEDGRFEIWLPLNAGVVSPGLSHRIGVLVSECSYSLWFRWPKTHEAELRGIGWRRKQIDKT